jgi:hypothetical protein
MRMLADLIDLGAAAPEGATLLREAHAWTRDDVARDEADAVHGLCRRLAAGEPQSDPLLDHVLAGALDDDYAASLKLRALGSGPSRWPRPIAVARDAFRAVFPGRERLAALDAGRSPALSALLRPFEMARRAVRALSATVR